MATRLPQVQGGQVQLAGVPNVVLPEVRFGQRDASTAYKAQADYQQNVSNVIDRMTQTVFGIAEGMSQRAGLEFAAENPLTAEQLEAMSKGDMSDVSLGSPLNVFNSAVRKARALEVSGHAEIEAREQMAGLLQKVDMGELDATQVQDQIAAITNGYGESLAQIDPDASYKFRATMGAVGGRVLEKVAELDGQKRMIANTVKVQRLYTTMQQEIALAATTKMPIDQSTGQEIPVDAYVDALKTNFLSNAQALIGINGAAQYVNSIDEDINASKVSAISQYLNTDPSFANSNNGISRLLRGDAGSASNAFQALLPEEREKVIGDYRSLKAQRRADMQASQAIADRAAKLQLNDLVYQFHDPQTSMEEKEQLGRQIASSGQATVSQIETYLNPSQEPGDPVTYSRIERGVRAGAFTSIEEIESVGTEAGLNRTQIGKLINKLTSRESSQERSAVKFINQYVGVPDQATTFASDSERRQFQKKQDIEDIFDELVVEYRTKNPDERVPFQDLAKESVSLYEETTGSQARQDAVVSEIERYLDGAAKRAADRGDDATAERLRNVPVNANMSPEDLFAAGLIDRSLRDLLEAKLNALRD